MDQSDQSNCHILCQYMQIINNEITIIVYIVIIIIVVVVIIIIPIIIITVSKKVWY